MSPRKMHLGDRLWRQAMLILHRPPIHAGWTKPLTFYDGPGNCFLCRAAWRRTLQLLPDLALDDSFADKSQIEVSPPEYDADGKIIKRGVVMNATVKRQLDAITTDDPDAAEALQKMLDQIAREP